MLKVNNIGKNRFSWDIGFGPIALVLESNLLCLSAVTVEHPTATDVRLGVLLIFLEAEVGRMDGL